jgi:hypothetical protein
MDIFKVTVAVIITSNVAVNKCQCLIKRKYIYYVLKCNSLKNIFGIRKKFVKAIEKSFCLWYYTCVH